MSDRRIRGCAPPALAVVAIALIVSRGSEAQEVGSFGADPLRVAPRELRDGARLPGDLEGASCARKYLPDAPLDLPLAADLALCNSPKARETWESIKVQAGVLGEARAAYLPTVTGSYTWQHERNTFANAPGLDDSLNGTGAYLGVSWRLFDFGGRAANREASELLLAAALSSHDAQLQQTLDALVAAYFDAMKARAELQASRKSHAAASETLAATERREERGVASHSDVLQAQVALAKTALTERRALGTYDKALAVLGYATALPLETAITLPDLDDASAETVGELSEWLGAAERQHPALVAAREQWQAAVRNMTVTRSAGLPTLDLSADLYQNGYPNQGIQTSSSRQTTVGFTVTVPLFEGFARTYKIHESSAQADAAQAQAKDTEYQVLMNVVKAHADAVAAAGNLELSGALLAASKAAADSSERRYASGAASVLELLTSHANLADAEQQRAECVSDWFGARLRLMAAAGTLGLTRLAHPSIAHP